MNKKEGKGKEMEIEIVYLVAVRQFGKNFKVLIIKIRLVVWGKYLLSLG